MSTLDTTIEIRHAQPRDRRAIANALSLAFHDDPVVTWMIPDERRRRDLLPEVFSLFTDAFLPHGELRVTDDGVGAALWAPPGVEVVPEDQAEAFGARIADIIGSDAERCFELMAVMEEHHPQAPAYYLQLVAVVPGRQGRGIGAALMAPVLEQCDREGVGAYLEATSEASLRLYERLGFVASATFAPAGGPPLWPMWRQPRG